MGVNDIVIDPNNSNIMYISTGIGHGDGSTYDMGILKTTNGQSDNPTWNATGLTYDLNSPSNLISTQGIFISPASNTTLFALMNNEIWKSTDGGATFTKKSTISTNSYLLDLVFLPSNSSVIFVSSINKDGAAVVLKSTDNGSNWTDITSNLGFSAGKTRIDLAVTNANGNLVMASGGTEYSYEISKTTNSGVNWSKVNSSFSSNNSFQFSIGLKQNEIAISPDNADVIYLGGTLLCKSTDGGLNFNILYGYYTGNAHPDVRDIFISKDGQGNDQIYQANDGGLDLSENGGNSWKKLNGTGLSITQIYGFDFNLKKDWIAIGTQDLGFYNSDNGTWTNHCQGDGIRMIFNPFESTETIYGQTNGSYLYYSNDRGANWANILGGSSVTGTWERKMAFDALGNLYIGNGTKLYRRNKGSNSFVLVGSFPNGTHRIWGIGVSKSNPNVIYVGFDEPTWSSNTPTNRLFKTTNALNGSPTWTDISSGIFVNYMGISDIVVDPNNSEQVWVITGTRFLANTTADRVHFSNNGGSTFTTINQGLNVNSTSPIRFPINVAVIDEATGGMYIGTDIGVYYNSSPKNPNSSWVCFNKDLPTAIVTDLKIDYCSRKILASTFGRGLWESNLAETPKKDYTLTSQQLLNVNTGETRIYYSDITIPSGQTFTVKGLVRMAPNRKITVKPGAKILIDGGKITSTCDLPWAGIRVEGNSNANQLITANQGYVQMINNATLENALNAVSLIGLRSNGSANWSKTGGIIQATNSNFLNNKRDVEFMSYHPKNSLGNEISNRSFFKLCKFTTNAGNKIPNNQLGAHITMWDVNGVQFQGCIFEDLRTLPIIPKINGRLALYTINSNYSIGSYCSNIQIPCNGTPSQFNNLKSSIQSYSNGTLGVISIEYAQFNSYKGAFLQGTIGSLIRSNTFNIGHDIVIPGLTDYPYGLYLDKCQRFNTEGNQFNGTTGSANVSNGGAAGLVIRNTGPNNNIFYRSYFDNLKMASQALSENRDINLTTGLIFRCNDYQQTWNDMDVRNDPNNPASNGGFLGMKELQSQNSGSNPTTPDNLFANSSNILNLNIENRGNWMQYVYSGTSTANNRLFPSITTNNVVKLGYNSNPNCPDKISLWGQERGPLVVKLNLLEPVLVQLRVQINGLTDGGNTTALKNAILNANASNVNSVISQLLGYSPHLSNEILALLAERNAPFSNEMIRDVMLANPHSARCLWVRNNLDARSNPLPQLYRDQIDSNASVYTQRDQLGSDLSAVMEDYDFTLHELLYSYEVDSNSTLANYSNWLKHPANPSYHYQLAEKYFDQGDWAGYLSVKDSIPIKLSLNERQMEYHTTFSTFYGQLHTWQLIDTNLFSPDSLKKDWLLNFASTHNDYPAKIHALLAVNDTFINHSDVYIPDSVEVYPMFVNVDELKIENNDSEINLYPNPANALVYLEWKGNGVTANIIIMDVNGRTISEHSWNGGERFILHTQNWPNGVYFIKVISNNGSEAILRRVIISR